ncbi:MAG: AAA family ATPase [Acidobacteria bacterium]|nr:AAA family ATPase [Acidobacteriota bacterium]
MQKGKSKQYLFLLQNLAGIKRITVSGYKSISQEQSVEIRPLTLLAGANSSGKSSIVQPLLLLKQTLEAPYDPGALLLNGPNVKFTSFDQLLSSVGKGKRAQSFFVGIEVTSCQERATDDEEGQMVDVMVQIDASIKIGFGKQTQSGFDVQQIVYNDNERESPINLRPGIPEEDIVSLLPEYIREWMKTELGKEANGFAKSSAAPLLMVGRERCYLKVEISPGAPPPFTVLSLSGFLPVSEYFSPFIREILHLPGLRGNPERAYPVTAVGAAFPGTFEHYTASIIARWQTEKKEDKIAQLSSDLERLGLTWKVAAKRINDTQVELQVGRRATAGRDGSRDMVNIADVGFGVSQTLPVLVALHTAKPGQFVYLEQPEIHLHPRAQTAMAQVLADAAKRGVRVIAETHSSLLLLGVQTLVAEGELPPELVKLHWFTRDAAGSTTVRSADLDEAGAYGDWPEDFDEVALTTESRYIDAAARRQQVH